MKKVLDDVYLFTLDLPFAATPTLNVYFLEGKKPTIIDTGLGDPNSMSIISNELKKINRRLGDISMIINTHEHVEHFGGNKKIKDSSGACAIASIEAGRIIENYHQYILDLKKSLLNSELETNIKRNIGMYIEFNLLIDESKVERKVKENDVIDLENFSLRVIETPGHADGEICLYDEDRKILFSGDHIIGTGTTFVGYSWREISLGKIFGILDSKNHKKDIMSVYLESLEKLQSLDLKLILSAHGPPITEPYKKIKEDTERKLNRERVFLKLLEKKEEVSLGDLTAEAYNTDRNNFFYQGAALGYLERLIKLGKIKIELKGTKIILR
ncbi:MAG: MBL fold metallo-hydrolase [Candidatus Jordarchaeaceae archaeon]